MWGCCYVSMLKRVACQNLPKLKSGESTIFSITSVTRCPMEDHDNNCERGLRRFNSVKHFNLMLLQLLC